jgi:HEAT repeat protein
LTEGERAAQDTTGAAASIPRLLKFWGLNALPADAKAGGDNDLQLLLEVKGSGLGAMYSIRRFQYTGAAIEAGFRLVLDSKQLYARRFLARLEPLGTITINPFISPLRPYGEALSESGIYDNLIGLLYAALGPRGLTAAAGDRDAGIRSGAMRYLVESGLAGAPDTLITGLGDANAKVRRSAAEALGALGSRAAVNPLIKIILDDHMSVMLAAITALGEIGDNSAIEVLVEILHSDAHGYNEKQGAIKALSGFSNPTAIDALINVVQAEWGGDLAWPAAASIAHIGGPAAAEALVGAFRSTTKRIRDVAEFTIVRFGDADSLAALLELSRTDPGASYLVAEKFGSKLRGCPAVDAFIRDLQARSEWDRRSAAKVLGVIGDARAVAPLVKALDDPDDGVRAFAAEALGTIRSDETVEALLGLIAVAGPRDHLMPPWPRADRDDASRAEASRAEASQKRRQLGASKALGLLGDKRAVPSLMRLLAAQPWNVEAALALGLLGEPQAGGLLLEALRKFPLNSGAARALGMLKEGRAVDVLVASLRAAIRAGKLDEECSAPSWALGEIKDGRAAPVLIEALRDAGNLEAAEALGKLGDKAGLIPLIQALSSKDPHLQDRRKLYAALAALKDPKAFPPMLEELKRLDYYYADYAAGCLVILDRKEGQAILLELLAGGNQYQRNAAALTLGILNDRTNTDALVVALLMDNDPSVRIRAAKSLGREKLYLSAPVLREIARDDINRKEAIAVLRDLGSMP